MPRMDEETKERIRHEVQQNQGALTKYGYCLHCPEATRHKAIDQAVAEDGAGEISKRLTLLKTWNENNHPELSQIADEDRQYLGKKYGHEVSPGHYRFD
jgi:hypothetical protein